MFFAVSTAAHANGRVELVLIFSGPIGSSSRRCAALIFGMYSR